MKRIRKLLCGALAAATMLSMSVTASAEIDNDSGILLTETVANAEPDDDSLVLVSSEERVLEDGYTVEVNTFLEDGIETYASKNKYYKCTASYKYKGNVVVKLFVWGTFYWDEEANRAYVKNPYRDYEIVNGSWEYKDIDFSTGDDQGGYFGGKRYSYVEVKLAVENTIGTKYTYSLSFDVDVTGERHIKTTFGEKPDTTVES